MQILFLHKRRDNYRYGSQIDVWSVGTIICEMLNRKPLFAGDSEIDQIYKIFQKLGTPNEQLWRGVSTLQDFNADTFPAWQPQSMISMLKRPDEAAADLLQVVIIKIDRRRYIMQKKS